MEVKRVYLYKGRKGEYGKLNGGGEDSICHTADNLIAKSWWRNSQGDIE